MTTTFDKAVAAQNEAAELAGVEPLLEALAEHAHLVSHYQSVDDCALGPWAANATYEQERAIVQDHFRRIAHKWLFVFVRVLTENGYDIVRRDEVEVEP